MFNLFSKKPQSYFTEPEQARIVEAIKNAEMRTSGEVRIYIENKCRFMNPVHRAQEMFYKMGIRPILCGTNIKTSLRAFGPPQPLKVTNH